MDDSIARAVDGYVQLARWWVKSWGDYSTNIAHKVDDTSFDSDDAVDAYFHGMSLAVEGANRLAYEACEAIAVIAAGDHPPHAIHSETFSTVAGWKAGAKRNLKLRGPLTAILGPDSLPTSAITITPDVLDGNDEFALEVNATGHEGLTYIGWVDALDAATNAHLESIRVWVIVP